MDAPMLKTATLATLEAGINSVLRYDPGTRLALAELEGQVLEIEVTAPRFTVYFAPGRNGVAVAGHSEGEIATRLRGTAAALVALAARRSSNLSGSGVEVWGNTGFLSRLQHLLAGLDVDWEEVASRVLGDVAAHEAAGATRALRDWFKGRADTASRLLGEYLTEETRSLPTAAELRHFYGDVDQIRLAADRLAARLERVRRHLESTAQATGHRD